MIARVPSGSVSTARFGWSDVAFLAVLIVVAGALNLHLSASFDLFWYLLFLPIIVVVHEAGHAVASVLLRHRIFEIRIGAGPALRLNVGRTHVLIGLLPLGGHVASGSSNARGFRWKRLVIIAAGPAMNAVMFGIVALMNLPSNLLRDFAVVNAFVLINNLLPVSQRTPLGPQTNDGLALVRTFFDPETVLEEQRAGIAAAEAQRLAESGNRDDARERVREALTIHPHSRILRNWLGHDLTVSGQHAEAREVFSSLVEDDRRSESSTTPRGRNSSSVAIHLNNLAWADLMLDDPELVSEANAASAKAIELLPGPPAIWGTRAFALIATSHFAEGITLAQKAFKKERDPKNRSQQASVVAIGYARNWRFDDAEKWLAIAIRLDPDSSLLDLVTEELAARRSPAPSPLPDPG
jgi:tetratricopeptide (TPR) repeat protein